MLIQTQTRKMTTRETTQTMAQRTQIGRIGLNRTSRAKQKLIWWGLHSTWQGRKTNYFAALASAHDKPLRSPNKWILLLHPPMTSECNGWNLLSNAPQNVCTFALGRVQNCGRITPYSVPIYQTNTCKGETQISTGAFFVPPAYGGSSCSARQNHRK